MIEPNPKTTVLLIGQRDLIGKKTKMELKTSKQERWQQPRVVVVLLRGQY
jgi:hypothetical protein